MKITNKLNSYSLNYVADVEIYPIHKGFSGPTGNVVKSVFSSAIIVGKSESNTSELLEELIAGLSYAGDPGAHSNLEHVGSSEHKQDFENLKNKLKYY